MTSPIDLTLAEARDALKARKLSAAELTETYAASMEAARPLNAFITETAEKARAMAAASDEKLARGEGGALEGIPLAVKDLYCTEGVATTAASHILDGFVPTYESTVTAKLWQAGAVLLGKTNLDEFAMGSSNLSSYYGPAVNPWTRASAPEVKLVPGGSSGGSAVAVAARAALAATGTDTGGSIRQPAAFTGITGMKPTYGRCSRWGIIAYASSLDQAGPMARNVRDTAIMMGAMAGHDPKDSTSVNRAVPDYEAALGRGVKGMRIGIPKEYRVDGLSPEIAALWDQGAEWLKAAGAEIVEISLPHSKYALPAYYIVAPAEASSNLARYDGVRYGLRVEGKSLNEMYMNTRGEGFGKETRRRILIGTYVLSAGYYDAYYLKAQKVRARLAEDFRNAWTSCDMILAPTTPTPAFGLDEPQDDPVTMYLNDVFTITANLVGIPGLALPAGLSSDGLPLGLQLLGRPFDEETLFSAGQVMEEAAGFTAQPAFLKGRA